MESRTNQKKRGPRNRQKLPLCQKLLIIEKIQAGQKACAVAKEFNCPNSTVRCVFRNREKLLNVTKNMPNTLKKESYRHRPVLNPDLEHAVVTFVKEALDSKLPVNRIRIREKAREIATNMKLDSFRASDGWVRGFIRRQSLLFWKRVDQHCSCDIPGAAPKCTITQEHEYDCSGTGISEHIKAGFLKGCDEVGSDETDSKPTFKEKVANMEHGTLDSEQSHSDTASAEASPACVILIPPSTIDSWVDTYTCDNDYTTDLGLTVYYEHNYSTFLTCSEHDYCKPDPDAFAGQ